MPAKLKIYPIDWSSHAAVSNTTSPFDLGNSVIWLVPLLIGIPVGLIMGLTGAGGGMLALSALVLLLDWNMAQATPLALMAVTAGAFIGAIDGLRKKLVRYRAALLMAMLGSPFAVLGVQVARVVSQQWLMGSFALVLLWVASRLLKANRTAETSQAEDVRNAHAMARLNPLTGRFDWSQKTAIVIASIGGVAGFMTGLLGVGGGFVIVPLLRHYSNLSMHGAIATSLLTIGLVGSVGVSSALLHGVDLPQAFSIIFIAATILGMLLGRRLITYLPARTVQILFAMLLLLVAASMMLKVFLA
ncbi:sulfite exporter TauE/SafE family protein [Undibacterium sp. Ren11W]|uniref:sulfite exporter TauE/SafE family protein n=1 Tax=Undibacterium sp. Ren11W TaxID=3413045 RepID=UPI003BF195F1